MPPDAAASPAIAGLFSLEGRTALVTGGGTGLGRAIAHALSDAGARLLLVGRREGPLSAALEGRRGAAVPADLTAPGAAARLAEICAGMEAAPDIVVNAAGANPRLPADSITEAQWDAAIHLNLSVPFLVARAFAPGMAARGWGRILNIASMQTWRAMPNGIAYGAAKGGIAQLTRAMAEAWSPRGVTANALAPGFFPTELTAPVFADPELAARNAAQTCIGRNGEMADIRGPAVFLCSDAAGYVTGQVLPVDGGFTAK